jgi:hypothetical protein
MPSGVLDSESTWIDKLNAFTGAELKGYGAAGSFGYWRGVTERFGAVVGAAPSERTEPIHGLMVEGCEKFEAAARDGSQSEMEAGGVLFVEAADRLTALVAEWKGGAAPAPTAPSAAAIGSSAAGARGSRLSFDPPAASEVTFASPAIVKRRKMSYGKPGVLMLSADRLTFVTADAATSWQVPVAGISRLKKPWYGMGSYVTCTVAGAYYAFAFGRRGPSLAGITSASGLAVRFGGAAGVGAGIAGDAIAVSAIVSGAHLGGQWFGLLRSAIAKTHSGS